MCKGVNRGRLQGRAHLKFAFLDASSLFLHGHSYCSQEVLTGENELLDNSSAIGSSSAVVVFFGLPERAPALHHPCL